MIIRESPEGNAIETEEQYSSGSNLKNRLAIIMKLMNDPVEKRILDVGCRTGIMGQFFIKRYNCEVFGIDINDQALEIARKKGLKVNLVNVETQDLPYPQNFFDKVIFAEILEHLVNYRQVFRNIHHVLKKEGALILSTPNLNSLSNRMTVLLGNDILPIYRDHTVDRHVRLFSFGSVRKLLVAQGFKNVEAKYVNYPASHLRGNLYNALCKLFPDLGEMMVVKATK
jgi:2-polyprenyl-3-methyl-5-hydroxy-6-metoxy-1,4-benzoquinol methylase